MTGFEGVLVPVCSYRGAVAADGRIEPGDMLLEVSGVLYGLLHLSIFLLPLPLSSSLSSLPPPPFPSFPPSLLPSPPPSFPPSLPPSPPQVNNISFENMSNDDAVKALREIVQQTGPITLTVAKCWEPEPVVPQFEPRSSSQI